MAQVMSGLVADMTAAKADGVVPIANGSIAETWITSADPSDMESFRSALVDDFRTLPEGRGFHPAAKTGGGLFRRSRPAGPPFRARYNASLRNQAPVS